jgi:putative CocE/NonD family hydrolase
VARGYAVVIQDVRGRYASAGEFAPHVSEGRDGYDSIEWLAGRTWCDGRVGGFGLSYPGSAQWFAALERPPHLLAMAPAMSFASLQSGVWNQGVFDMDWLRWALVPIAPDMRARAGLPGPKTTTEAWVEWKRRRKALLDTLPLLSIPELKSAPPFLRQWLEHPPGDPWWAFGDLAGRYSSVRAAVLNLSGWHDDAFSVAGAIANHRGIVEARQGQGDPRSLLILGPWSHGINAVTGERRFSERDFGPEAGLDYDGLVLDFMDRHVLGRKDRLKEAGYNVVVDAPNGIGAPAGVPDEVMAKLRQAFRTAVGSETFQQACARIDAPLMYLDAPEYRGYVQQTIAREKVLIDKLKLKELLAKS